MRDRHGGVDGLNLFFGALLGANLGTLDGLKTTDYVNLVLLLAGTVASLRMLSVSERRGLVLSTLVIYSGFLAVIFFTPKLHPKGMAVDDLQKLVLTVAIWVGSVMLMEFWPRHDEAALSPEGQGEAQT
jgi:predicted membrane channel-forming protein YqfA (hemolysin III family)